MLVHDAAPGELYTCMSVEQHARLEFTKTWITALMCRTDIPRDMSRFMVPDGVVSRAAELGRKQADMFVSQVADKEATK